ncbi:MAG: ABC transporter permease [Actinomycetota bacterium]|nr:ABC transporter permease [Actinomycetota bacterium]
MGDRLARTGLVIVAALAVAAVLAPVIAPHDPLKFGPARLQPPSWGHLFGTDRLGRDILSRLLFGARLSVGIAIVAALVMLVVGLIVGSVAGLVGGVVDAVLMRVADIALAFPSLIFALAVAGLFKGGITTLVVALVVVQWAGYARLVRGNVLSLREREYVEAARASGASQIRILRRHIWPAVISPLVVLGSLEIASMILAISALSFLGLGVQPPAPEWGAMVNEGRNFLFSAPHAVLFPGLAIGVAAFGFSLLGDSLRDALDPGYGTSPRRRRRRWRLERTQEADPLHGRRSALEPRADLAGLPLGEHREAGGPGL